MSKSAGQVSEREATEALRLSEHLLDQGIGDRATVDAATDVMHERADAGELELEETPEQLRNRLRNLERMMALNQELLEGFMRDQSSGSGPQAALAGLELEKLRLARIKGLCDRGAVATIIIHPNGENPAHNWPILLGLNGQKILVERGVPTPVPAAFLMVLEEARQEHVLPQVINGELHHKRVSFVSYPYSIVDTRH